jgi:hypothetical protein
MSRQAAQTIDEAAWLGAACAFAEKGPPDFKIQRKRKVDTAFVVMYTAMCLEPRPHAQGPERIVGYTIVRSWKSGWDSVAGGYYVDKGPNLPTTIAHDDIGYGEKGAMRIIFGEVFKPEQVAAIEVTLSDGQVLRDEPHNPFFILIAPLGVEACERRALAADGTMLERKNLGPMIPACQISDNVASDRDEARGNRPTGHGSNSVPAPSLR